jgi:hypothetical protein
MWYEANVLMKKVVKLNLLKLLKAVTIAQQVMARAQA